MKRIAMWSGPRNISTAMMRAWGNRPDTVVVDEPLYAHYLLVTKKPHPGAEEVLAQGDTDWRRVVEGLTHDEFPGCAIYYQKHMTHHLLPQIDRQWLRSVTNVFLIRNPADVITSYLKKADTATIDDLGFLQQGEIFDFVVADSGQPPPVVDAEDVQNHPRRVLGQLCETLGVPFDENLLHWPPGLRDTDGIWAKHWYPEVAKSTGFRPYQRKPSAVPESMREILRQGEEIYERLRGERIKP